MGPLRMALVVGVVGVVLVVPAAPALAQSTTTSLDRDAQEVKSYRLSMSVLEKLGAIHKAAAAARMKDPRYQQRAAKKAELAALEAKQEPTDAEQERMGVLAEEIERLEQSDDEDAALGNARTLSEMAGKIDALPALAAAVRGAGMTTREFATAELALLQAGLAYGLQKAGRLKQLPDEVSKENVEFVRQHEREIEALRAEWEKAAGDR
jgi:hypothetical protein